MLLLKWLLETVDLKRQDITNETWQTVPWEKTGTTEGETLVGKKQTKKHFLWIFLFLQIKAWWSFKHMYQAVSSQKLLMIFLDVCRGLQSPQDDVPNSVSYPGNVSQCTRLKAPRTDVSGFENQTSCPSFFLYLLFLLLGNLSSFCMGHSIYWESVTFLLSETSE